MDTDWRAAASDLFEGLFARTHLSRPSDAARVVVEETVRALGATEVVVYWVNREQRTLVPIPNPASPHRDGQDVDGTVAGRCFTSSAVLHVPVAPGRIKVFVPVLDGTDRLGVLELEVEHDGEELPAEALLVLERLGHATAMSLVAKMAYGDSLELAQRSRAMDLGAELLWSIVPPLTFATEGLVLAAMLEPAYENGGDAFDYAVNDDVAHLGILDGVGHGLAAAGLSTFATAAYRHSRRSGLDLVATYAAMDAAVGDHFSDGVFATAVLGRLDLRSGSFAWVNAGHPPPLLLRDNRVVKVLSSAPATALGMPMFGSEVVLTEEQLEPGDAVVLYTDGVTEAQKQDGGQLGLDGLVDFLERHAAAGLPAPETLRRLRRTLVADEQAVLRDDATVLMAEWRRGSERQLVPLTVLEEERPT